MTDPPTLVLEETPMLVGASQLDIGMAVGEAPPLVIRPDTGAVAGSWSLRLLRAAEGWHEAQRHAGAIFLDLVVATIVVAAVTSSWRDTAAAGAGLLVSGLAAGLWRPRTTMETQGALWLSRPVVLCAVVVLLALAAAGATPRRAAEAAAAAAFALVAVRAVLWQAIGASRRRGLGLRPAMVIASDEWASQLRHRMGVYPEAGLDCVSVRLAPGPGEDGSAVATAIERVDPAHVVLAGADQALVRQVAHLSEGRFDCSLAIPVKGSAGTARIGDVGLVMLRLRPGWGSMAAKRVFDVAVASAVLLCTAPVLILTAVAIRLGDGGPAFFSQKRVGRDGQVFSCLKFRSMVVNAEQIRDSLAGSNINVGLLFKVQDDPRITPVGRLIRRLSIDELPQLLNVLRGDMSLVGPRPLPVDPDDFESEAASRHTVPPGITGLWQVHGGNALSYPDMLDLDLTYVATRTLALDIALIARTLPALIVRRSAC